MKLQLLMLTLIERLLAFYGDRIVWALWGAEGIYVYNISTSNTTRISNSSSENAAIYGDRIVWAYNYHLHV